MALQAAQQFMFGGVDSSSSPLNMPTNRFLVCRNFVPCKDGHLELRRGYSKATMASIAAGAIHSIYPYKVFGGNRYILFLQGTTPKALNVANGNVSTPTVKGSAISSSSQFSYAEANNRLMAFNGTDRKFFDGVYWRDLGIRVPTAAEVAGVNVAIGAANANAVPASSIGGARPGYVFWMAWWNRTTGAVGNCIQIGSRLAPSVASEIGITGLPDPPDDEWDTLIGRTKDGALVPYAIIDGNAEWVYVPNGTTSATITQSSIDGNSALPTRNGVPPAFDKICQVGTRLYGNLPNSPYIYRSESPEDSTTGTFVGSWEQAWHPNNIETFPTGGSVSCLVEYGEAPWAFTRQHLAILDEASAEPGWQGPWEVGCAGQQAFCKTPYGPFWISGRKQGCTMSANGPIPVSDEYEKVLLSKIGKQYLGQVECRYVSIPELGIDHVQIKARDASGKPFRVIHDFNLRDERNSFGQGYEDAFRGQLESDYTTQIVYDADEQAKLVAGASDGRLYDLYADTDDDGNWFKGEALGLLNFGPDRPRIPYLEWFGDRNVNWRIAQSLNAGGFIDITPTVEEVPGGENDFQYRVALYDEGKRLNTEGKFLYIEITLKSHSEDGNLVLNDPPHFPLEDYGRIYLVSPLVGKERGHAK